MHHWIAKSPHLAVGMPPLANGIAANCPFCAARNHLIPYIGQRLKFLSNGDIGQIGTRIDDKGINLRSDQFIVEMEYETRGYTRTVSQFDDLYITEPFLAPPTWMPSLSIQDSLAIHESMLNGLLKQNGADCESRLNLLAYSLIGSCWRQRLPVTGDDVWPMLEVHGMDRTQKRHFGLLFDFGFQLLVRTNGRKPIRRKKMPSFSKGRYLSKNARLQWMEHFGHD